MAGLTRRALLGRASVLGVGSLCFPTALFAQSAERDAVYAAAAGRKPRLVETASGRLAGLDLGGVDAFLGVPYGHVPANGRFLPARPVLAWSGVIPAKSFGPACSQNPSRLSPLGQRAFGKDWGMPPTQAEDCLSLNIWAPRPGGRPRPVMVWFHGGGFNSSSSANPACDGANLARHGDLVTVSFNHRVGLLGFLDLRRLGPDYAASANIGMQDMVAALQWVRDNIAAFGGDPGNVTIFGGAAGGEKISALLAMPSAGGLFHKAIIQSGPRRRILEPAEAGKLADAVLAELGLPPEQAGEIRTMPVARLLAAEAAAVRKAAVPRGIGPAVDGVTMPGQPFDTGAPMALPDVPILIGTNKDEMTFSALLDPAFGALTQAEMMARVRTMVGDEAEAIVAHYAAQHPDEAPAYLLSDLRTDRERRVPSITQAEMIGKANRAPIYMYEMTWESPLGGRAVRATHMLEQPLVFRNRAFQPELCGTDEASRIMSDLMSEAWIAFARTGDPAGGRLPRWPTYETDTRWTMRLDVTPALVADPGKAERELWQRFGA